MQMVDGLFCVAFLINVHVTSKYYTKQFLPLWPLLVCHENSDAFDWSRALNTGFSLVEMGKYTSEAPSHILSAQRARTAKSRDPNGLQLEVRARRAPRCFFCDIKVKTFICFSRL